MRLQYVSGLPDPDAVPFHPAESCVFVLPVAFADFCICKHVRLRFLHLLIFETSFCPHLRPNSLHSQLFAYRFFAISFALGLGRLIAFAFKLCLDVLLASASYNVGSPDSGEKPCLHVLSHGRIRLLLPADIAANMAKNLSTAQIAEVFEVRDRQVCLSQVCDFTLLRSFRCQRELPWAR